MAEPDGVRISLGRIHELLIDVRDDVRDLKTHHTAVTQQLDDHEDRLRLIEKWKYTLPVATFTAIAAAAFSLLGGRGAA